MKYRALRDNVTYDKVKFFKKDEIFEVTDANISKILVLHPDKFVNIADEKVSRTKVKEDKIVEEVAETVVEEVTEEVTEETTEEVVEETKKQKKK